MKRRILIIMLCIVCAAPAYSSIADNMIELRQQSERALSLFIACDFDGAIRAADESIALGERIIYDLRAEARLSTADDKPTSVSMRNEPERSRIFSTVRKYVTEAIKYYIINRNELAIPKIRAVMSIMSEMTETARRVKSDMSKEDRDAVIKEFVNKGRDPGTTTTEKTERGGVTGRSSVVITNVVQVYRTNIIVTTEKSVTPGVVLQTVKTNLVTVARTNIIPVFLTNVRIVTNVITAEERVTKFITAAGITNEVVTISTNVIYHIDPQQKRVYLGAILALSVVTLAIAVVLIIFLIGRKNSKRRRKSVSDLL